MTRAEQTAAPRPIRRLVPLLAAGLTVLWLGGCGSINTGAGGPNLSTAQPASSTKKKVAFAPIIGAPSTVSKSLESNLVSEVERHKVPVAKIATDKADYTIRGYVVAAPAAAGTELSYIWDVMDDKGKRAHRITGKEIVKGPKKGDPWGNVDEAVLKGIASKTAAQLAAWVPSNPPPAGTTAATHVSGTAPAAGTTAATAAPVKSATATKPSTPTKVAATRPGIVEAYVPSIKGAPGDGNTALATAIKRQLIRNGVKLAKASHKAAYSVRGNVAMGKATGGKQPIRIEWQVFDPAGKKVGTVSQKNSVPQGSLDGAWGKTADAAATAAAQGIVKLLPKSSAVN